MKRTVALTETDSASASAAVFPVADIIGTSVLIIANAKAVALVHAVLAVIYRSAVRRSGSASAYSLIISVELTVVGINAVGSFDFKVGFLFLNDLISGFILRIFRCCAVICFAYRVFIL